MSPAPAALSYPPGTHTRDALRAEWSKLLSVSGPAWLLAALVGLTVAVSAAADAATRCPAGTTCSVDTVKLSLTGVQLGQAIVAILAVLPICSEYSTGMMRVTLAAMPRRLLVLAAKVSTSTGLVLVAGAFAVLGSLVAGLLILPGHGFTAARGFTGLSLTYGPTLRAAIGSVLYLGLIAVLSMGIAALVRDSAVAIGLALGVLYVFPAVTVFIGNQTWHQRIERYTPMAGLSIQSTTGLRSLAIGPWGGLCVLALWALAALLAGGLRLRLSDA
jgi:ABC-2 type transport system permease protein